jgi:transposase-like protein
MAKALSGYYCAIPCQVTDETYVKVRGKWVYLYRAVDRGGQTLDFMMSERRDTAAARRFSNGQLAQTVSQIVLPSTKVEPIWLACKT